MPSVTVPVSVLIAGEINLDLILHDYSAFPSLGQEVIVDECLMTLGSASAITAVGLSRLGVPVRFVGKIGQDSWGDQCLEEMRAAGVDTSLVSRTQELQTGITVSVSSSADRALVTFPGAIAELRAEEIPDDAWKDVGHLHISSYYLQRCLQPAIPDLFRQARELKGWSEATAAVEFGGAGGGEEHRQADYQAPPERGPAPVGRRARRGGGGEEEDSDRFVLRGPVTPWLLLSVLCLYVSGICGQWWRIFRRPDYRR